MRDTVFPRWQGGMLAVFLLAEGLYLPAAPQAVWSLVWGTLAACAAALVWMRCLRACGARDFASLCRRLPRAAQIALAGAAALASLAAVGQSLWRLSGFWQTTTFPGIPRWVSALVLLAVGWCAGRRGRTAVAMWAYPTAFLIGLTLAVSLIVTTQACVPAYLTQALRSAAAPDRTALRLLPAVLPLLLCTQTDRLPASRACARGVLLGGGGLALLALRAWLVLGSGAARLPYPAYAAAGVFSVGDFLQRGEVVFGCALALCEAVRTAVLLTLARSMVQIIRHKNSRSAAQAGSRPAKSS